MNSITAKQLSDKVGVGKADFIWSALNDTLAEGDLPTAHHEAKYVLQYVDTFKSRWLTPLQRKFLELLLVRVSQGYYNCFLCDEQVYLIEGEYDAIFREMLCQDCKEAMEKLKSLFGGAADFINLLEKIPVTPMAMTPEEGISNSFISAEALQDLYTDSDQCEVPEGVPEREL